MIKPASLFAALVLCGCDPVRLELSSCGTANPGPSCPQQETCAGQCVPIPPYGWELPGLLWFGPELEAPACPVERAPVMGYEGHADPIDSPECPVCTCEPPTGECELPSSITAYTEPACAGATTYDFSAPDPWDGTCNSDITISAAQSPKSVRIAQLTLTESGCKPPEPPPPRGEATSWKTFARACRGYGFSPCLDPGMLCVPTAEPPPQGFLQCIYQKGDLECPPGYPEKHVFYDDISDTRKCSECSCGAPEGGACVATVSVFHDGACGAWRGEAVMDSYIPKCVTLDDALGDALGSKQATPPVYEPGWCKPIGGEVLGSAAVVGPSTFCCQ